MVSRRGSWKIQRILPAQRVAVSPSMLFGLFGGDDDTVYDVAALAEKHPPIRVENLSKTFRQRKKSGFSRISKANLITAVDNLSFTVQRGSVFGLLGPNSSGKTTALQCLATLTKPDSGSIEIFGINTVQNGQFARNVLGIVLQSAGFDKVLTGREHLDLFADLAHLENPEKGKVIDAIVDMLNLGPFIDLQTAVYSGGVQRRLDLAIALLHRPPILLLDEPTVGLDIDSRRIIWGVVQSWRDGGGAVILSSHYLEEVDILCDQVGIMDKGLLIANGTPTELKNGLGGDRISVRLTEFTRPDEAESVLNEIRKRNLIRDGIINRLRNNTLEFVVDSGDPALGGRIVQALRDIGYPKLFSFSQAKPSLDDVFLAATGKTIMDADVVGKSGRSEKSIRKENMR